jgi:uncharacterized protein YutE (UPF0331/DUF86 family)
MALEFTDEFREKIRAEIQNVETALKNLKEAEERQEQSVIELAATATFIHNIYNGIENILIQIFKSQDIKIPITSTWHKDLLDTAAFRGIISNEMSNDLYDYLAFRHFFVHAYAFMLEEPQMAPLSKNISDVWTRFLSEIGFQQKQTE